MPTNIYGYNDNFSLQIHMLCHLIQIYEANENNKKVTLWGTGSQRNNVSEDLLLIFHIHTMQRRFF